MPVYDTVSEAVELEGANTAMVFVPPRFAADAIYEAASTGVHTIICIAEGIPAHEMLDVYSFVRARGVRLLGPNCPGALSPGIANVGIIPPHVFKKGPSGSSRAPAPSPTRSATSWPRPGWATPRSSASGATRSSAPASSTSSSSSRPIPTPSSIVMVGEIGGDEEEKAARYIDEHMTKPVVAYIAGFEAPAGKTMGHAGAIISGTSGTAQGKKEALEARGIAVGTNPTEAAKLAQPIACELPRARYPVTMGGLATRCRLAALVAPALLAFAAPAFAAPRVEVVVALRQPSLVAYAEGRRTLQGYGHAHRVLASAFGSRLYLRACAASRP